VRKLKLFVIGHFSCCWHQHSRAFNFLYVIEADEDFFSSDVIGDFKARHITVAEHTTSKLVIFRCKTINLDLRKRWEFSVSSK
jgi:hypothetical protein